MKLKVINENIGTTILTEADADRGARLKLAEDCIKALTDKSTSSGFKVVSEKDPDKGFNINNIYGYLWKISVKFNPELFATNPAEAKAFSAKVFNFRSDAIESTQEQTSNELFGADPEALDGKFKTFVDSIIESAITANPETLTNKKKISEKKLTEAGIDLFGKMKSKIKNFFDKKAADKETAKANEDKLAEISEKVTNYIKEKFREIGGQAGDPIKLVANSTSDGFDIVFKCPLLLGVTLAENNKNKKNLLIAALKTPFGDININSQPNKVVNNMQELFDLLLEKGILKDKITLTEEQKLRTAYSEAPKKDDNSDTTKDDNKDNEDSKKEDEEEKHPSGNALLDALPASVRAALGEKLNTKIKNKLVESIIVVKGVDKFDKALAVIDTDDEISDKVAATYNLIKYYIMKATGFDITPIEEDENAKNALIKIVKKFGKFNLKTNNRLAAILYYIRRNAALHPKFVLTCVNSKLPSQFFIDHVDEVSNKEKASVSKIGVNLTLPKALKLCMTENNPSSFIYIKQLYDNSRITVAGIKDKINLWYDEILSLESLAKEDIQNNFKNFYLLYNPNVDAAKVDEFVKNPVAVKSFIFLKTTKEENGKSAKFFRDNQEISAMINALKNPAKVNKDESGVDIEQLKSDIKGQKLVKFEDLAKAINSLPLTDAQKLEIQTAVIDKLPASNTESNN